MRGQTLLVGQESSPHLQVETDQAISHGGTRRSSILCWASIGSVCLLLVGVSARACLPSVEAFAFSPVLPAVRGMRLGTPAVGRRPALQVREMQRQALMSRMSPRMAVGSSDGVPQLDLADDGVSRKLRQFDLDDIALSRYLGEISYSVVDSYEPGSKNFGSERDGQTGTQFPGVGTPRFQKEGLVKQRLFLGDLTDISIRTKGLDTRVLLREFSAESGEDGDREIEAMVAREIEVMSALADSLSPNDIAKFSPLSGEMTVAMQDMQPLPDDAKQAWMDNMKSTPPRSGAKWLVYPYEGLKTASSFSVPAEYRVPPARNTPGFFGIAPSSPRPKSWEQSANFAIKGIIRQTLEALTIVHGAGYAVRALAPESIVLGTLQMDKDLAIYSCDTGLLRLKLQNFAFASLLSDDSADRQESARRWKINPGSGLDRMALSVAEDLNAAGYVFLSVLLGALAEPEPGTYDIASARSIQDYERLIEDVYRGDVSGGFRENVAAEPRLQRAGALLDANMGQGWDFLETMIKAREAAASTKDSFSYLTASKMLKHPFLSSY